METSILEYVVAVVGDEQLTVKEIASRVLKTRKFNRGTIQRWLTIAFKMGRLARTRTNKGKGMEYRYFAPGNDAESMVNYSEPFVIQALCPSCGHERLKEFHGNVATLQQEHSMTAWTCGGCGDYVRLMDCIYWRDLSLIYSTWKGSQNPELDVRDCVSVSLGSLR